MATDELDDFDELDDEPGDDVEDLLDDADLAGPSITVAFTPRQILGGFALLAALIVILLRRRGRAPSTDD